MHYEPRCPHMRQATTLCISKECVVQNCFCCTQCKRFHSKNCQYMDYKKFVNELHKRQGLKKSQICRYQERVENTFNSLIKALKSEFIEFREQFQRFNASEEIIRFYDAIQSKKQKLTSGQKAHQLLEISIPRMVEYRIRDQIEMKRMQNNIFQVHSYVVKKLRPYYALRQKFQQVSADFPEINEIRLIEEKYVDLGSVIGTGLLKDNYPYVEQLLGRKLYNIHLIFRASENNFSCQKFHKKCDGKKNTLVLARTEFNRLVGLWCPFVWSSPSKWVYIKDSEDAFIFSFEQKLKGMKFHSVKYEFAIGMHRDYGPIFGDDFVIYDKSNNSKSCWSNFPDVYNCQQKPLPHTTAVVQTLIGIKDHFQKFNILQWQVYKMNFGRQEELQDASWMEIYDKV